MRETSSEEGVYETPRGHSVDIPAGEECCVVMML